MGSNYNVKQPTGRKMFMKLTLKNKELNPAISLLDGMALSANSDSRHRSKLINLLSQAIEGMIEEEKELLESHGLLDENKELLPESERNVEAVAQFNADHAKLLEEEVVISGGMYEKNIKEVQRILYDYTGELSGEEAVIYDRLLDEFEKNETEVTE